MGLLLSLAVLVQFGCSFSAHNENYYTLGILWNIVNGMAQTAQIQTQIQTQAHVELEMRVGCVCMSKW